MLFKYKKEYGDKFYVNSKLFEFSYFFNIVHGYEMVEMDIACIEGISKRSDKFHFPYSSQQLNDLIKERIENYVNSTIGEVHEITVVVPTDEVEYSEYEMRDGGSIKIENKVNKIYQID